MKDIEEKLDSTARLAVKYLGRWRCQNCGRSFYPGDVGLECSHWQKRDRFLYRWDLDNLDAFCRDCHAKMEKDEDLYDKFIAKKLGKEKMEEMKVKAKQIYQKKYIDHDLIFGELRNKLAEEAFNYEKYCERS